MKLELRPQDAILYGFERQVRSQRPKDWSGLLVSPDSPCPVRPEADLLRSNGLGIMVSVLTNGRYIDWRFRREEKRVGGDYRKMGDEFKIERTRYGSTIPYTM
jgi:hypothetical protein